MFLEVMRVITYNILLKHKTWTSPKLYGRKYCTCIQSNLFHNFNFSALQLLQALNIKIN